MLDVADRLKVCLLAVFPDLSRGEIDNANAAGMPDWDSMAVVTLAGVIEEEFQIVISAEEYEQLISFELMLRLITGKLSNEPTTNVEC
jgi:acyl carrier protein